MSRSLSFLLVLGLLTCACGASPIRQGGEIYTTPNGIEARCNAPQVVVNERGESVTLCFTDLSKLDDDNDGVMADKDNCPSIANDDQSDFDEDGFGNACDKCFDAVGQSDDDNDGVCDDFFQLSRIKRTIIVDNCPNIPNSDQLDTDGDGVGDVCDSCPLMPNGGWVEAPDDHGVHWVSGQVINCPSPPDQEVLED